MSLELQPEIGPHSEDELQAENKPEQELNQEELLAQMDQSEKNELTGALAQLAEVNTLENHMMSSEEGAKPEKKESRIFKVLRPAAALFSLATGVGCQTIQQLNADARAYSFDNQVSYYNFEHNIELEYSEGRSFPGGHEKQISYSDNSSQTSVQENTTNFFNNSKNPGIGGLGGGHHKK